MLLIILFPSSFVVHYIVEKEILPTGKIGYQASLQRHKQLGLVSNAYFSLIPCNSTRVEALGVKA